MSQDSLHSGWLQQILDPYAVLGISVTANEQQILKRYHFLARQLHPDRYKRNNRPDNRLAQTIFTSSINPAYQQVKKFKHKKLTIETLRTQANNGNLREESSIQTSVAREMMELSALEADLFYEQAVASLASVQYKLLDRADLVTQQIRELNLVYLCFQRSFPPAEQSTALVTQAHWESQLSNAGEVTKSKLLKEKYAPRHYQRAVDYVKQSNWKLAVQELRDAIKLKPQQSDYHALLGLVHLKQNLPGMARVYMRQALKLDPKHRLALKYAPRLQINPDGNPSSISMAKAVGIAAMLSKFINWG